MHLYHQSKVKILGRAQFVFKKPFWRRMFSESLKKKPINLYSASNNRSILLLQCFLRQAWKNKWKIGCLIGVSELRVLLEVLSLPVFLVSSLRKGHSEYGFTIYISLWSLGVVSHWVRACANCRLLLMGFLPVCWPELGNRFAYENY